MAERLAWVDVLKGLGIASVVAGHVFSDLAHEAIFLFHMPLFFFVSGYLFRPQEDRRALAIAKAHQLLVPYVAYLAVLGSPLLAASVMDGSGLEMAAKLLAGGLALKGVLGVFWFVTCLYATVLTVNEAMARRAVVPVVLVCLLVSYGVEKLAPTFWLPLGLNVVPAALLFFVLGHVLRQTLAPAWLTPAALLGVALAVVLLYRGYPIAYDMKYGVYGVPLLSLVLAACCIQASCALARVVARLQFLAIPLARLGQLSLGIMFLHQPIQFGTRALVELPDSMVFAVSLITSLGISAAFDHAVWSRALFLGARRPQPETGSPATEAHILVA